MYTLRRASSFSFPPDTYVLDVAHLPGAGVACITSSQHLALLRPDLSGEARPALTTAHGNVTALRVVDSGAATVCTAGEDGSVSVWDLRRGDAHVARFQASQAPVTSLACDAGSHSIAVGTELQDHNASIVLWDVRASPSQKRLYTEVHSDDITELNFHPKDPNILLSGSTDGLVNVCDTRISDEDEVVVQTFNHDASIHHAGFLNDTDVFALSHDERFAIYSMAEEQEKGVAIADFGDVREKLGCQYVANVTPKLDGSGAILGAGAQDQHLFSLIHLSKNGESWELNSKARVNLPGSHGEEIVRGFCFFDEEQVVYTCGEDGKVNAWHPGS